MPRATYVVEFPGVASQSILDGLFGIMNNSSAYAMEIRKVDARLAGQYGSTTISKVQWSRITALSGGTAVAPVPYNSTAAPLPSQVLVRGYASDIQATLTDLFRTLDQPAGLLGVAQAGQTTTPIVAQLSGDKNRVGATSWYAGQPGGGTRAETIVLREGQGAALSATQVGGPHSAYLSMTIRVVATGSCYEISDTLISIPGEQLNVPLFAIFNGVGSGVVIEFRLARITVTGSLQNNSGGGLPGPDMRLALIDGWLQTPDNSSYVPSAFNSSEPLPPGFVFASGFTALARGWNEGHEIDWPFYNGGVNPSGATIPIRYEQNIGRVRQHTQVSWYAGPTGPALMFPGPETIWDCRGGDGILIRPGQGFAGLAGGAQTDATWIIDNNVSSHWTFRVTFTLKALGAELSSLGGTYVS